MNMDKKSMTVWKRAFRIWQQRPHEVAPISDVWHTCQSCGTEFQGNFCPRCGQSASIGRFSFKKALLLFLDIWGVGNRSMFRSIRDLMLRPGYMIRDYIRGCQSAYFPPFKMFFLLATFSVLLSHGLNFKLEDEKSVDEEMSQREITLNGEPWQNTVAIYAMKTAHTLSVLEKKNSSMFAFVALLLASAPLYYFLRRSPAVPGMRYSEHVVALVYTSNMYSCYQLLAGLMPFDMLSSLTRLAAVVMIFVALSQLTGFSKKRLLLYFALTFLFIVATVTAVIGLLVALVYQTS